MWTEGRTDRQTDGRTDKVITIGLPHLRWRGPNYRVLGTEKPDYWREKPLHDDKVTVWCALSSVGVIGPFFFESEGETTSVNSTRYLDMLRNEFLPSLRKQRVNMGRVWFQQDGATPHTSGAVLTWLHETFGDRLISYRTNHVWPPHSPDLNPLDFFLWGYLKEKVYTPRPENLQDLKTAIRREVQRIKVCMCSNAVRNFDKRLDVVIEQKGRHIEHMV